MSKKDFFRLPLWDRYSKKMLDRLEKLHCAGCFFEHEKEQNHRLVKGESGRFEEANLVVFFLLVDEKDGLIVDAKFQAFADSALLAIADITASFVIGKTYDQIKRINKELIIKQLADEEDFLSEELSFYLALIVEALQQAVSSCHDIPLERYSPLSNDATPEKAFYPAFLTLSKEHKLQIIEEVLTKEIRPYIALDEGGVEIVDLLNENELIIAYKGNCTSCYSSVGSTLSAIQEILQEKVHPDLSVTPNLDNFNF